MTRFGTSLLKNQLWLLLAASAVILFGLVQAQAFYHDDAYISLRYVERFLAGKGLNWTAGAPVEGFTHPMWVGQLIVLGAMNLDLQFASRLLGLLYLTGTFALWYWSRASLWLLLALAALPSTAIWTVSGLETIASVFWMLLATICVVRLYAPEYLPAVSLKPPVAAGLGGFAVAALLLHRPDAILFAGLLAAGVFLKERRAFRWFVAAAAIPLVSYFVFRLIYFGDFQPNSARAKMSGIPLAMHLQSFWAYGKNSAETWVPLALASTLGLFLVTRRSHLMAICGACGLLILPIMLAGGDHMIAGRLFLPVLAFLGFTTGLVLPKEMRLPRTVVAAFVLVPLVYLNEYREYPISRDQAAAVGAPVGQFLEQHLPPGTLVATATAGSTPYFSPSLEYIDTLGLNDEVIARRKITPDKVVSARPMPGHYKGDGAYVLSRKPDVIILGGGSGVELRFLTDMELLRSKEFEEQYEPYRFFVDAPDLRQFLKYDPGLINDATGGLPLLAYLRKDSIRAHALAAQGEPVKRAD